MSPLTVLRTACLALVFGLASPYLLANMADDGRAWAEGQTYTQSVPMRLIELNGKLPVTLPWHLTGTYRMERQPSLTRSSTSLVSGQLVQASSGGFHVGFATEPTGPTWGRMVLEDGTLVEPKALKALVANQRYGGASTFGLKIPETTSVLQVPALGLYAFKAPLSVVDAAIGASSSSLLPQGFGKVPSEAVIVITPNRARVMARLGATPTWVPIAWIDARRNRATFRWETGPAVGLEADVTRLTVETTDRKAILLWKRTLDEKAPRILLRAQQEGSTDLVVKGWPMSTFAHAAMAEASRAKTQSMGLPGPTGTATVVQEGAKHLYRWPVGRSSMSRTAAAAMSAPATRTARGADSAPETYGEWGDPWGPYDDDDIPNCYVGATIATVSPLTVYEGEVVTFTGVTESGLTAGWIFGDGNYTNDTVVANQSQVTHIYTQPGYYTIKLIMTGTGIPGDCRISEDTWYLSVQPGPAKILSFAANPMSVIGGGSTQLTWSTSGASNVQLYYSTNGSTYTYHATYPNGTAYENWACHQNLWFKIVANSATGGNPVQSIVGPVTVHYPNPQIQTFTVNSSIVDYGSSVTFTWSTSNGIKVDLLRNGSVVHTSTQASNTVSVTPDASAEYRLRVTGASAPGTGGTVVESTPIPIVVRPQIEWFWGDPGFLAAPGSTSTLRWSVKGAAGWTWSLTPGNPPGLAGLSSYAVSPTTTTTYELRLSRSNQIDVVAYARIDVLPPPVSLANLMVVPSKVRILWKNGQAVTIQPLAALAFDAQGMLVDNPSGLTWELIQRGTLSDSDLTLTFDVMQSSKADLRIRRSFVAPTGLAIKVMSHDGSKHAIVPIELIGCQ